MTSATDSSPSSWVGGGNSMEATAELRLAERSGPGTRPKIRLSTAQTPTASAVGQGAWARWIAVDSDGDP